MKGEAKTYPYSSICYNKQKVPFWELFYLNNIVNPITAANVATATMKSRRIE